MKHRLAFGVLSLSLICQTPLVRAELPPLIPREVLFDNPDKARPRIAPDGKRLAYLAPDEGVLNVWVRTIGESNDHPVTKDRGRGVRWYTWAPNGKQILFGQDRGSDQDQHLLRVDLETKEIRDLTPFDNVQARVIHIEMEIPDQILVGFNNRDPELHDIYRVDLTTGELELVLKNDGGFIAWIADQKLEVRAVARATDVGGFEMLVRDNPDSPWRTLSTWEPQDTVTSDPVSLTHDGKALYVLSSAGANTRELRQMDLATGKEETLASDRLADVDQVFWHPAKHTIQAVSFNKERTHWKILDPSIAIDFATIKRIRRGDFTVINRDHHDRIWLVGFVTDDGPMHYYTYDRNTRKSHLLFTNRRALEGIILAKMFPISFRARDGLTIPGYLTTPRGVKARNLPMVVLVHSSPWSRDRWGFDLVAQWLANRGYAVLHVNFRGSLGYGKAFTNAGNREWGGKMNDDLIDGVNWAVAKGIADPGRIAIFGESYGGYAALMAVLTAPKTFCCSISAHGPVNLVTWIERMPPAWRPLETIIWDRIGHPQKDAELLKSRSPFFQIDRLQRPVLIANGANDVHVVSAEVSQMVKAIKQAGKSVLHLEYPDEGSGFAHPENRLDFFAHAEKFLATHLGGRYEQ